MELDFQEIRPFMNFLEEFVERDEIIPEDPVPSLTAWIREFRAGDMDLLTVTGYAAQLFQTVFNHEDYGGFFNFAKPLISTTTKSSICTMCTVDAAESTSTNPEVYVELKDIDRNLTLEDHVLEHFNGNFISEEAECRMCGTGFVQIDTKQQLASLPSAIIVKLAMEQYDQTNGRVIQKRSLKLGNNLKLESLDGSKKEYELVCSVQHTGLSGDSTEAGHFVSFLKKTTDQQEHCW